MITDHEKEILENSCRNADVFGVGRISNAKENIIDAGYTWTHEHEMFVFEWKFPLDDSTSFSN